MTISINGSLRVLGALCGGLGVVGCGSLPDGPTESGDTLGTASIALTQVPSPVQCIRVVASGSSVVTTNLSVTVGSSSASLNIGRLPLGPTQFSASAFDLPCSGVGTAQPSWVADNVTTTLRAGVPATVGLTFRTDNSVTVNANFVQSALEIAPLRFSFGNALVMADNTLRTTGFVFGVTSTTTFTNVGFTDVQSAAGGPNHLCVIRKSDGSVACAGLNGSGELGPNVPIGGSSSTLVTVPLPTTRVRQLAAGRDFTCAMAEPDVSNLTEIYCWGDNSHGQLGATTMGTFSATPVKVGITVNDAVYAGDQFACTISFGDAWCWGANAFGQLGNGTTTDSTTPVQVQGGGAHGSLALGSTHACTLSPAGAVLCWGSNGSGELGNGTNTSSSSPVNVVGLGAGSNVVQLAAGTSSGFARFADGTLRVWGNSDTGQLGLGDDASHNTPTPLTGIQDVAQIASSGQTTLALLSDRNVFGWGLNNGFNIGDGTRTSRFVPTKSLIQ